MNERLTPQDGRPGVMLFPGEKETLVAAGEIAVRFRRAIDAKGFGRPAIILDDAELAKSENQVFVTMRDAYVKLIDARPEKSVLVPVRRLREALAAVQTDFVRFDLFVQGKSDEDSTVSHVVGPKKGQYQFSVRESRTTGAIRITEVSPPDAAREMTCADSAVMFGAQMAERTMFMDEAYAAKVQERTAAEAKKVKDAKRAAQSSALKMLRKKLKADARSAKRKKEGMGEDVETKITVAKKGARKKLRMKGTLVKRK